MNQLLPLIWVLGFGAPASADDEGDPPTAPADEDLESTKERPSKKETDATPEDDDVDVSRTYLGIATGLTAVPYDTEIGLLAGLRLSPHLSFEGNLRTEALSLLWAGTWWNAQIGLRLVPLSPATKLRPSFAIHYGGGGLTNKYSTVGNPIYEEVDGERVPYPSKVVWSRHVTYSRLDLEGGIRWQRPETRANVQVVLGVYTVPGQKQEDEWLAREKQGLEQELLDTTFRGVDGAGYSHWFEAGHSTVMIRVILGMDLI